MRRGLFSSAFTLMEMVVAVVIVAILAAIAIPSYMSYLKRSAYGEIVAMADRYKASVATCVDYNNGTMTNCNGGSSGIPANIVAGPGVISTVTVTSGVIVIVPKNQSGITSAETYVATPTYSVNGVTWAISGGVCGTGYISDC